MNDKELLELAALAVGAEIIGRRGNDPIYGIEKETAPREYEYITFNPLAKTREGLADCLQMEMDLGLDVVKSSEEWHVSKSMGRFKYCTGSHQDRQRASTMAAAEIGKSMKKD